MDKWASSIPITDARARTKFAKGGVELPNELKYVMKEKENFNIMDNNSRTHFFKCIDKSHSSIIN